MQGKKDFSQVARDFVTTNTFGTLSTLSVAQKGYPFGSITPYDIHENGSLVIYISLIAEHYRNLSNDPHASLCINDPLGFKDPQAHARATVLADFVKLEGDEAKSAQERYEKRFPGAINYEIAHNFVFLKGTPVRVRWIGGFGDIGWVRGEAFSAATPDPLAYHAMSVLEHMNEDHHDALIAIAEKHTAASQIKMVRMTRVNSLGFDLVTWDGNAHNRTTIAFENPVDSMGSLREVLAGMTKDARH